MGSKYHRQFSGKSTVEGSAELLKAVDTASSKEKKSEKEPYEAGFMMAGGHAMTSIEVIRKH